MFIPKLIQVTEEAKDDALTTEYLVRCRSINPKVKVVYVKNSKPELPAHLDAAGRYHHMKETLLICRRSSSFIETFESPGHIVERMSTMVKSVFNCSSSCEFCYLGKTALRQQHQKLYSNIDVIEQEMLNEIPIHIGLNTILSAYAFYNESPLLKIPPGFKKFADEFRNKLSRMGKNKISQEDVSKYINDNLAEILLKLDVPLAQQQYFNIKKQLPSYFAENKKFDVSFNIGEYTDIGAIDHISGHLKFFADLVEKHKNIKINFMSKSPNLTSLLKAQCDNRVLVTIGFNPQSVIDKYEHGTYSLKERIAAAKKVQKKGDINLKLEIEPIIFIPNYEKEYIKLIRKLLKELDVNKISKITMGGIRLAADYRGIIPQYFPDTDLLDMHMEKPDVSYDRYRYPLEERVDIYLKLIAEIKNHCDCEIGLGAETPELWEAINFDAAKAMSKNFFQYLDPNGDE